ncbi:MAG TPA: hypothetical protein VMS09_07470 [Paenibacillus sp.]|uniref:DUF6922 domain-containing protein n=1 Tax=Paenibacillus sp. TaxID=58172 RepID=UPI0028D381E9|nr:hypothetical protein [Paenibacillus sp.]HUC91851.1 hypothetical protein [Paenibacillus sp.]
MPDLHKQIPADFNPFFWDVHIEQLEPDVHRRFIIERLLNEGDHYTLQWLFHTYTIDDIRQTVQSSRNLSRKTARYWQTYFNLEEEEMRCFGMSLTKPDNLF